MAQEYGIRKYLTDQGYKDDEINWDPNRKMVTLQGKDFMNATPRSDNLTYGTGDELGRALSNYQGVNQQSQNMNRQSQLDTLADRMMQRTQAPAPQFTQPDPFNYHPWSDPQYHSAISLAQNNAQTAQNNTLARLQSTGQGKSSYSETLANQIAQKEMGRVSDTVLPQLMQQAYGRWLDQANMGRQNQMDNYNVQRDQDGQLAALAQYLSGEDQRQFGNTMAQNQMNRQGQQDNIALAQWLTNTYGVNAAPKEDAGVAFNQIAGLAPVAAQQQQLQNEWAVAEQSGTITPFLAEKYGLQQGMPTQSAKQFAMSYNQRERDFQADQDYRQRNEQVQQQQTAFINGFRTFEATGQMPEYMSQFGIDVQGLSQPKYKDDLQAMYQMLSSGTAPKDLLREIDNKIKIGLESREDGEYLKNAIYQLHPELNPNREKTNFNVRDALKPSDNLMNFAQSLEPELKQVSEWVNKIPYFTEFTNKLLGNKR